MNMDEFKFKTRIIRENFKDARTIKCPAPEELTELDDSVHPGGDIFMTEDGEFVDFEIQLKDFDEEELTKYVEFAENLYEKHEKRVSVYILCDKHINITVKECPLKSEADFTIKLACSQDACHVVLFYIKNKLKREIALDCQEISLVENLPVMCKKEDRRYFRLESIKILNSLDC